jgi:uncharacterized membrane protein YtjA (UPF0391 family)
MLLSWVVIFLLVAIVAGFFGFGGVAQESAWIAKVLFFIFLVLFIVALLQDHGYLDTSLNIFSRK